MMTFEERKEHVLKELQLVQDILISYRVNIKDPEMHDYAVEQLDVAYAKLIALRKFFE